MLRLNGCVEIVSLRMRWIFMSPKKRYAYLWSKTKKLTEVGLSLSVNDLMSPINNGGQHA